MALVSSVEAPAHVSNAIRRASAATGVDFNYLLTTAARESNFQTQAKARTSSAAGLFQFIESTWLQTLKEEGERFGLERYAPHIFKTSSGRYYVPDRQVRAEILKLRHDPDVASVMAGAFTQQNAEYVESKLGRAPTQGELYIAHFLGRGGATRLIGLADTSPAARASAHFPKAAAANRGIFYDNGRPRTVAQVYDLLVSDHSRLEAVTVAAAKRAEEQRDTSTPVSESPEDASKIQLAAPVSGDTGHATDSLAALFGKARPGGVVEKTRVAALADTPGEPGKTITDSGMGAIGPWQTIVEVAARAADTAPADVSLPERKPSRRPVERPPLTLESRTPPSKPRTEPAPARRTSRTLAAVSARKTQVSEGVFGSNYWMNLNLSGS